MPLVEFPWAYIGPDVLLPFASVLAGILGVLLIGWRYIMNAIRKGFYFVLGKNPPARKYEDAEAVSTTPTVAANIHVDVNVTATAPNAPSTEHSTPPQ